MQFEQVTKEERRNLPRPSIDTGMGLERIAAVLQGVHSNYEIDLFAGLIDAAAKTLGVKNDGSSSLNVIADHIRACTPCMTAAMRSRPMPVSTDGLGRGGITPLSSRLNCMNTRFQISM